MEMPLSKEEAQGYLEAVGATSGGELAAIQALADLQLALEAKVLEAQDALATAQEDLKEVCEKKLPEAMDACGMKEVKTSTGLTLAIQERTYASIKDENKPAAFKWLRDHNHAALLTRLVAVSFGRGEDSKAEEAMKLLRKKQLRPTDKTSIHPQTLGAFVREQLAEGKDIPLDLFGVHRQRVSVIKVPKPQGKKG